MARLKSPPHMISWEKFWMNTCWLLPIFQFLFISKIVKGAVKLYFMYYLHAVIILFSTGLYNSAFSTYSFAKLGYRLSLCVCVCVCVCLCVCVCVFSACFMFWIRCHIKILSNIWVVIHVLLFYCLAFTLWKGFVDIQESCH